MPMSHPSIYAGTLRAGPSQRQSSLPVFSSRHSNKPSADFDLDYASLRVRRRFAPNVGPGGVRPQLLGKPILHGLEGMVVEQAPEFRRGKLGDGDGDVA